MDFDLLDPTPEQRRTMDALAITHELAELRQLPRAVLDGLSTRLTMAAAALSQSGKIEDGQALLHTARLLYVLAHETLPPPLQHLEDGRAGATCAECGHPERRHSPLISSDAARFRCSECSCVRVVPSAVLVPNPVHAEIFHEPYSGPPPPASAVSFLAGQPTRVTGIDARYIRCRVCGTVGGCDHVVID